MEPIRLVLGLAVALMGVALWILWRQLRLVELGQSLQDAQMREQVRSSEAQMRWAVAMLQGVEQVSAGLLGRLADQVEKDIGHNSQAYFFESLASDAQRSHWHDFRFSDLTRQYAFQSGIRLPESPVHMAAVLELALEMADKARALEMHNEAVTRLCQIAPKFRGQWLAEVLCRHERLCGSREASEAELREFLQRRRAFDDGIAADMIDRPIGTV